jgi:hypothetical protein
MAARSFEHVPRGHKGFVDDSAADDWLNKRFHSYGAPPGAPSSGKRLFGDGEALGEPTLPRWSVRNISSYVGPRERGTLERERA